MVVKFPQNWKQSQMGIILTLREGTGCHRGQHVITLCILEVGEKIYNQRDVSFLHQMFKAFFHKCIKLALRGKMTPKGNLSLTEK